MPKANVATRNATPTTAQPANMRRACPRRDRRAGRFRTRSSRGAWRTGPRRRTLDPMLDREICDRARIARDSRFDGRFVSGVLTTRIYCRPVCPVRPARSANVIFFPTAAAAETAGFRPCLRCRPETAPFCSAWIGSRATVERALRLIVEGGALDTEGATVERLAERLGGN